MTTIPRRQTRGLRDQSFKWVPAKAVVTTMNKKLGLVSTTLAAQGSCPTSCKFLNGGGCYAEGGAIGTFHLRPMNRTAEEMGLDAVGIAEHEAQAIDDMYTIVGRPMRLHTVGDCSTNEAACIVAAAAERYMDRGGGGVWTYTHAWREVDRECWGRVSVLASCETAQDVRDARARGYATAIVVEEFEDWRRYYHGTEAVPEDAWRYQHGVDILPCPSQTMGVTCADCRLCLDDEGIRERGYSIAFHIHGDPGGVKRARASLEAACPTS